MQLQRTTAKSASFDDCSEPRTAKYQGCGHQKRQHTRAVSNESARLQTALVTAYTSLKLLSVCVIGVGTCNALPWRSWEGHGFQCQGQYLRY
jgi:hypothetical protein